MFQFYEKNTGKRMAEIRHLLEINSPAGKIYEAVTTKEGLTGWWTAGAKAIPEINSIAEFDFGNRYHNEMKIINLIPDKYVEWECIAGDKEWIGTKFSFDLQEKEGVTTLRFKHYNWREATDFFASCNYQWGRYMKSLKNYCESGKGSPFLD